jgi:hypothetical protein
VASLREVSAPGAPMSPLAFQVATDNLEIPRGKMLEKSSFVSGDVSAFLLSGGLSFFDFFGEDFADCFDGEAESLGGDRFPDRF